jgi:hypothetical protein
MKKLLENDEEDRSFIEVRAAGSILHDFYSGIEKIFRRVAVAMDNKLPKNEDWHKELLSQMAEPIIGIRDNFISKGLMTKLKEYLRFRHFFRNIYGFELKWNKIKPLCSNLENIFGNLKQEIFEFLKNIEKEESNKNSDF